MDGQTASNKETNEESAFIDESHWVPRGEEVVPAALLLKGHVVSLGSHYATTETTIIDRLLTAGRIDDSHHFIGLRIMNLLRLGTSKQGYATMQVFAPGRGYDNSDFCPLTTFIKITRSLKKHQLKWIRIICGLQHASYEHVASNSDLLKDSLESAEEQLYLYEQSLKDIEVTE